MTSATSIMRGKLRTVVGRRLSVTVCEHKLTGLLAVATQSSKKNVNSLLYSCLCSETCPWQQVIKMSWCSNRANIKL